VSSSTRRPVRSAVIVAVALVVVVACSSTKTVSSSGATTATAPATTTSTGPVPAEKTVWLCRPGLADDPCASDRTSTAVSLDGIAAAPVKEATANPKIDCFYVYPTVSSEPGPNSDLVIHPEEQGVAVQQASRFSSVCRLFAPMYRQLTLTAILNQSIDRTSAQALAYQDVLTAWQEYLRDFNHGRGVVFIGHSQGSFMLTKLLAEQVDPSATERKLLVSALEMGGNVRVPVGKTVGGDFQHIPTCGSADQTGCLIAYSSFAQTPPAGSLFGRASSSGMQAGTGPVEVVCTNPAALGGGTADLDSFIEPATMPGTLGGLGATILGPANLAGLANLKTPWVEWKGRYQGECVNSGGSNVLMVSPKDGASSLTASPTPGWGLHIVDMNLPLGNLVDDVRSEAAHYSG